MVGPAYAQDEMIYFEDVEPVTDVYLPYQGDFSDFKYAMGGQQRDLFIGTEDDTYAAVMPFTYMGDDVAGDDFTAQLAAAQAGGVGTVLFHVVYGVDEETYAWREETELLELWKQGQIQARPASFDVTVHLRPDDLIATYRPSSEEIPCEWVDRDAPYDWLDLSDYATLEQTENPFDVEELDFSVTWDQQSYTDGMASGADWFYLTGAYTGLDEYAEGDREYDAYERGLIRAEGEPKYLIRVNNPDSQYYYNPYFPRFNGYGNTYKFQINIPPDTAFDQAVLPVTAYLDLFEGGGEQDKLAFGLAWNQAEYEAGLASGAEQFTLSGIYGPHDGWTEERRTRWDSGTIQILNDPSNVTPLPELTVHVLGESLPFTVQMQDRADYLSPVFSFPWPNGAELVTISMSFDKNTWYTVEVPWDEAWECEPAGNRDDFYDAEGTLISISPENSGAFYAKLAVTGSAFAGETKVMIVTPDENGNWNMTEDPGGDHGGGGQGEHDRPGKEDPDNPPEPSTPDPEPEEPSGSDDDSKPMPIWPEWPTVPEVVPIPSRSPVPTPTPELVPVEETPHPSPEPSPEPEPKPQPFHKPEVPAIAPAQPSSQPTLATGRTNEPEPAPTALEPTPIPSAQEETAIAPPSVESPPPTASVSSLTERDDPAKAIPGFAVAAVATGGVILSGAGAAYWWSKKKK